MRRLFTAMVLIGFGSATQAATLDTSNWTEAKSPSFNALSGNGWSTAGTSAGIGRKFSTLVSDYGTDGDFTFSGQMRHKSTNAKGDGNMGVVFGWTDEDNHYRMGWEYFDTEPTEPWPGDVGSSEQHGFWLIRETAGMDSVLVNIADLFFEFDVTYDFSIERDGDDILYSLFEDGTKLAAGVITDTTYMSGKVGVYAERNASTFDNLDLKPIPLPGTLPLLAGGLVLAGFVARRRRN